MCELGVEVVVRGAGDHGPPRCLFFFVLKNCFCCRKSFLFMFPDPAKPVYGCLIFFCGPGDPARSICPLPLPTALLSVWDAYPGPVCCQLEDLLLGGGKKQEQQSLIAVVVLFGVDKPAHPRSSRTAVPYT